MNARLFLPALFAGLVLAVSFALGAAPADAASTAGDGVVASAEIDASGDRDIQHEGDPDCPPGFFYHPLERHCLEIECPDPSLVREPITHYCVFPDAMGAGMGDTDCNESINSVDATLVLQVVAALAEWMVCPWNADVDYDAELSALDVFIILQHSAGLISSFPTP